MSFLRLVVLLAHRVFTSYAQSAWVARNMNFRAVPFNIYLAGLATVVAALCAGCTSPETRRREKVHYTELWLYEGLPGTLIDTNKMMAVTVANIPIVVRKTPFLTEEDLEEAKVIDSPGGGYAMQLRFNDHGRFELDTFTGTHRGRHLAVFTRYGIRKKQDEIPLKEAWLAAPLITRQVNDGIITFTPSVGKEELYSILDGLMNAIEVNHKPWVF